MPIARAGADQQTTFTGASASIVLDGSASQAADGSMPAFEWRQLSGPSAVTIVSPQSASTLITGLWAGR